MTRDAMQSLLPPKVRWDGTINWGHVLVALSVVGSVMIGYNRLEKELSAGTEARAKYIPMIESHDKLIELQAERLDRIGSAITELRTSLAESSREHRTQAGDIQAKVNDLAISLTRLEAGVAAARGDMQLPQARRN